MSVKVLLHEKMRKDEVVSVMDFMDIAMYDPKHGYYNTRNPIGKNGDFITSPEISQLFGEIIGVWAVYEWENMGRPSDFIIAEIGAGTGKLMSDFIKGTKNFANFLSSVNLYIVDKSIFLPDLQKSNISPYSDCLKSVNFVSTLDEIPNLPTIFIANELFDALPINQYLCIEGNIKKCYITLNKDDEMIFTHLDYIDKDELPEGILNMKKGGIFEYSFFAKGLMDKMINHINLNSGRAIIIDYGYINAHYRDTLYAIKSHNKVPVLQDIGNADLSFHVNFGAMLIQAQAFLQAIIMTQREFLLSYGIIERLKFLLHKNQDLEDILLSQCNRLISNAEMGALFKVLMLYSK